VLIYNDAYSEVARKRHPTIFGQKGSTAWSELWELLGPMSKKVMGGETVYRIEGAFFFGLFEYGLKLAA
jgi:hypothetical protein